MIMNLDCVKKLGMPLAPYSRRKYYCYHQNANKFCSPLKMIIFPILLLQYRKSKWLNGNIIIYFSDIAIAILDFSPLLLVKLSIYSLCILFGISSLLLFSWLPLLSYCSSNFHDSDSCCSFSLLKAIAIRLLILSANAFKSVKERQLLLSQSWKSDN